MSLDLKVDRAAPVPPAGLYRVPILERAAPGFSAMPKMPAWEPSYGAIIAPDWFWQATNAKEESAGDYLGIGVVQDSALEYFGGGLVARLDDEDVAANQRVIDTLLALEKQQVCSRDVGIDIVSVDGAGAESLEGQLHCRMIAESLHAFGAGLGLLSLVHWDTDVANGARIGDPGAAPLAEGVYGTVALRVDSDLKPTSVDLMVCIDRIVGIESEKVRLGRPIGPQGLEVISNARRDRPEDEIATEDVTFPAQPEIVVPIEFPDVVRWSMATSIPLDEHGVGKASQSATRLRGPGSSIDLRVTVR
jgi:hypothetical protein